MSDIKLKEAQAKMWIYNVNQEIEQVQAVLNSTSTAISSVPTDDDVIFTGLRKVGNTLQNAWGKLTGVFKDVGGILEGIIKNTTITAAELSEQVEALDRKYRT